LVLQKVKVSTQGRLHLLDVEDLRIVATSPDLFHDRMSTTVHRTPLGCHDGLHGRCLLDITSKGGDFRDDDDNFEFFARLGCLKDALNERLGNLVGNGAGVLGVGDAIDTSGTEIDLEITQTYKNWFSVSLISELGEEVDGSYTPI
jgi:hypothetical protein